jgi:hypothetical protein
MRLLSPESCVLSTGDAIVKAATCSVGVMNCKNERRCIYMHVFALAFRDQRAEIFLPVAFDFGRLPECAAGCLADWLQRLERGENVAVNLRPDESVCL